MLNKKHLFKDLWVLISFRRRVQFILLLVLMLIVALMEVVSLGAVLPFLGILTEPEKVYEMSILQPIIEILSLRTPNELILPLTVIFIIVVLIAGMMRLILLYSSIKYANAIGADLSIAIYRKTLFQDYSVHVSRNSSEIISGIITKTSTVTNSIVYSILIMATSFLLLVGIASALLFINAQVAILSFFGFGIFYTGIIFYTKKRLKINGECIAKESTRVVKSLQEGLGGIRDVLIDNNQEFYTELYKNSDLPLRKANGSNQFIQFSPRFIIEALGISLISIIAFIMTQKAEAVSVLPTLGALAIGSQRLMPAMQQAYSSYTAISGAIPTFEDTILLLQQPVEMIQNNDNETIKFNDKISLKDISFKHAKSLPYVFKNINLSITKGSRIGFTGTTGSGKSTLLDIVMCLLNPSSGMLYVDSKIIDKSNKKLWQANISHVPQSVFLADASIEENIAFGVSKEEIDFGRVKNAAKKAELSEMIKALKDGYRTNVGERGLMLSGGQRQRIGIARALYKQSSVLIFDEATSALDVKTEKKIMDTINDLNKDLTILIIAHRTSTLKECDKIINLSDTGNITTSTFEEFTSLDNI